MRFYAAIPYGMWFNVLFFSHVNVEKKNYHLRGRQKNNCWPEQHSIHLLQK